MRTGGGEKQRGFSVVEVLVSVGILGAAIATIGSLLPSLERLNRVGEQRSQATAYAREALDVVAAIQQPLFRCSCGSFACTCTVGAQTCTAKPTYKSCWVDQPIGISPAAEYHPVQFAGSWTLAAGSETLGPNSAFTRSVTVTSLNRNAAGVVVTSGGTLDRGTKRVTSTVSWNDRGITKSVELTSVITGWKETP